MALSKKPPRRNVQKKKLVDEAAVSSVINKGGSVAKPAAIKPRSEKAEKMKVQLRLDPKLVNRVDEARNVRLVPPSRHSWFLEAIAEKLERELAQDE